MSYRVVSCRTALSPSKLQGIDYAINPYRGCANGCIYCYGPYVLRSDPERWSEVGVKMNMPEVLAKELRRIKGRMEIGRMEIGGMEIGRMEIGGMERGRMGIGGMERGRMERGRVGIGTVTDPYQKGEGRYEVTRRCLQVLSSLASPPPITIQTKCSLVKRDLDLLVGLDVDVGFTITSLDSTPYEPYASSSRERIDCARALVEEGIETWAFIGPILPGLTDLDVRGFIDELSFFPKIFVDRFRPRPGMVDRIKRSLVQDELVDRLEAALSDGSYFIKVAKEIEDACKARGMECERVF